MESNHVSTPNGNDWGTLYADQGLALAVALSAINDEIATLEPGPRLDVLLARHAAGCAWGVDLYRAALDGAAFDPERVTPGLVAMLADPLA